MGYIEDVFGKNIASIIRSYVNVCVGCKHYMQLLPKYPISIMCKGCDEVKHLMCFKELIAEYLYYTV